MDDESVYRDSGLGRRYSVSRALVMSHSNTVRMLKLLVSGTGRQSLSDVVVL
jgi:hypothetical protein